MKTIFISGNDTDIGKTWVMRTLTQLLSNLDKTIQVIKPLECGVNEGGSGDVKFSTSNLHSGKISGHTFYSFKNAVAPLEASAMEEINFSIADLCGKIYSLPDCDWRIIEGAGGLAVPIDANGKDWADFAKAINADYTVLVIPDRLGFINQARLMDAYVAGKNLNAGIWMNEVKQENAVVRKINLSAAKKLKLPLWAVQNQGETHIEHVYADWLSAIIK